MKPIIYLLPTVTCFGTSTPSANIQLLRATMRHPNIRTTTLSYFLRLLIRPWRPPHPNPIREIYRQIIYLLILITVCIFLILHLLPYF